MHQFEECRHEERVSERARQRQREARLVPALRVHDARHVLVLGAVHLLHGNAAVGVGALLRLLTQHFFGTEEQEHMSVLTRTSEKLRESVHNRKAASLDVFESPLV